MVKGLKTELQQLKEELFDVKNEKEAIDKVGVACPRYVRTPMYFSLPSRSSLTCTHTQTNLYVHARTNIHVNAQTNKLIRERTHKHMISSLTHTHTHTRTYTPRL